MGQDEHIPLTEEQRENAEKLSAHAQQVNNTAFSQSKTQVNPLPLDALPPADLAEKMEKLRTALKSEHAVSPDIYQEFRQQTDAFLHATRRAESSNTQTLYSDAHLAFLRTAGTIAGFFKDHLSQNRYWLTYMKRQRGNRDLFIRDSLKICPAIAKSALSLDVSEAELSQYQNPKDIRAQRRAQMIELDQIMSHMGAVSYPMLNQQNSEQFLPTNPMAWDIGEAEYGISDADPIGTQNIISCIVIILRDPESHKTVLGHINSRTKASDLDKLIAPFAARTSTAPLQAKLIGAHERDPYHPEIKNLDLATDFLARHNVDLLATDVEQAGKHAAVTVNPRNFALKAELSGRKRTCPKNYMFHLMCQIETGQHGFHRFVPLFQSFDLCKQKAFLPYPYRPNELVKNIRDQVQGANGQKTLTQSAQSYGRVADSATMLIYQQEYDQQISPFQDLLEKTSRSKDADMARHGRDLEHFLPQLNLYLGDNARLANLQILRVFQQTLKALPADANYTAFIDAVNEQTAPLFSDPHPRHLGPIRPNWSSSQNLRR